METDDTGTAMTTFLEKAEIWMKNSNDNVSFVILCSSNKTGTLIESAYSLNMKDFAKDEEVRRKFLKVLTSEVKEPKKLKDELPQMYHDVHYKHAVGQKHGAVDKIPVKKHCSPRKENRSYADAVKKHEISESQSLNLPPPLLPGATKLTETITNSNMTTDMKAQSTSATGTKSKNCTASQDLNQSFTLGPRDPVEEEVPDAIPFGGNFQHETTSTDEVPAATTNFSMGHLSNTETLDAKASVVNSTCPIPRYIKRPQETSTRNGPATYPDGCMAKEMPGEPRAKSAESLHERSNEKKLRFIQDVNGWKDESASKYRIFVRDLEKGGAKIVKGNWTRRISKKILEAMQKGRPEVMYNGSSVRSLLRFIRNVYCHYHDLDEDVQTALGKPRAKVWDYFRTRYPLLLDHTYEVMKQFAEEDDFKSYYKIK